MLKKTNSTFCYPCCNDRTFQPELSWRPHAISYLKPRKDGKQSLKVAVYPSYISNVDNATKSSLIPHKKSSLIQNQFIIQVKKKIETKIDSTCQRINSMDECNALYRKKALTFKQNCGDIGSVKIQNLKAKKSQLIQSHKLKKRISDSISCNSNLLQFVCETNKKQLKNSEGSLTLGKYKQSSVSVYVQNVVPPRLDQSTVLIDYFNPASDKQSKLSSYLKLPE